MPVPKKRHSNIRQGKRRFSNYRLSPLSLSRCPECGAPTLPHQACPACGRYKGLKVLGTLEEKKKRKKGKRREKPEEKREKPEEKKEKPEEKKEKPEEKGERERKKEEKKKKEDWRQNLFFWRKRGQGS